MLARLGIALGLIALLALSFAVLNWLQRRRATSAGRRDEASVGGTTDGPRVLYFRSDECRSCATQAKLFAELDAGILSLIEKVDVDREQDRAAAYNVMTLPTTVVMDKTGEVKHINYGVIPPRRLKGQLATVGD